MIPGKRYTPQDILRIALRRKWLLIVPLVLGAIGVAGALKTLPRYYRSQTLILVVPQRVPESYVRSTVTSRIEDRLQSIREQVLSRTRLERVIVDFDLYAPLRQTMVMEDVIGIMRRHIVFDLVRGDAFRASYIAQDPAVAQKVTERLASLIIDENLRDREVLAEATNQFLETQLQEARARLVDHEKKLEAYRRLHGGELPAQVQSNMQALQTLQVQLQGLSDSVERDRDRLFAIDRAIAELPERIAAGTLPTTTGPPPQTDADGLAIGSANVRLASAQEALKGLETRFKPEHPDVVRMKRIVRELEAQAADERKAGASGPRTDTTPRPSEAAIREAALRDERAGLIRQIEQKDAQMEKLRSSAGSYQSKVDAAPGRESDMTELMRDYDTLRRLYTDLLAKREDSKVAANLERRQIGEQFKVLDPASYPERPFSPNETMVAATGLGAGLAVGLGMVLLLELRDRTFRSDRDVTESLNLPVLAMIPRMLTTEERRTHRRRTMLAASAGVAIIGVATVAALTWLR